MLVTRMTFGRFSCALAVFVLYNYALGATGISTTCRNDTVTEGERGNIQFFLRSDIDIYADQKLLLFLKKDDVKGNILQCSRMDETTKLHCSVFHDRFNSEGIIGHRINVSILNASSSVQGRYDLYVVTKGAFDPPVSCFLIVTSKKEAGDGTSDKLEKRIVIISSVIGATLGITVITMIVLLFRHKKRKGHTPCVKTAVSNKEGDTSRDGTHVNQGYSSPDDRIPFADEDPATSTDAASSKSTGAPIGKDDGEGENVKEPSADKEKPASEAQGPSGSLMARFFQGVKTALSFPISAATTGAQGDSGMLCTGENMRSDAADSIVQPSGVVEPTSVQVGVNAQQTENDTLLPADHQQMSENPEEIETGEEATEETGMISSQAAHQEPSADSLKANSSQRHTSIRDTFNQYAREGKKRREAHPLRGKGSDQSSSGQNYISARSPGTTLSHPTRPISGHWNTPSSQLTGSETHTEV